MERLKWSILSRFKKLPSDPVVQDMTEGQWIWMLVHMEIDNEERIKGMCHKCKLELEKDKCNTCGANIEQEYESNPAFDDKKFEELKNKNT